jgi:hypothetical protein
MSLLCKPEYTNLDILPTCSTEYESILDIMIDMGEITHGWEVSFGICDKKKREAIEVWINCSVGSIELSLDGTQAKVRI